MAIPFFKPPYPGLILQCNFCGRPVESRDFVDHRIRTAIRQGNDEYAVICPTCTPQHEEYIKQINTKRSQLVQAAEIAVEEKLETYAKELCPWGKDKPKRTSRKKKAERPTESPEIPQPPVVSGTI